MISVDVVVTVTDCVRVTDSVDTDVKVRACVVVTRAVDVSVTKDVTGGACTVDTEVCVVVSPGRVLVLVTVMVWNRVTCAAIWAPTFSSVDTDVTVTAGWVCVTKDVTGGAIDVEICVIVSAGLVLVLVDVTVWNRVTGEAALISVERSVMV